MIESLKDIPNPFGSSRVDTPFQQHLDLQEVYHTEFEVLTSALTDVKRDPNHQSKGAVLIGEAGSGKTHLIMRLAKERLKTNRLLFVRQPNNSSAVFYHTYARILESFAERIPSTGHTQLEQFLASSFAAILRSIPEVTESVRGKEVVLALEEHGVYLYSRARTEDTAKFRETWKYILRYTGRWWTRTYANAGYAKDILIGIVKFCSYTDPHKKEAVMRWLAANELTDKEIADIGLNNWQDEMSREEFALEAMAVFGKLSVCDEPLAIVFDQLEGLSTKPELLESFSNATKEMLTYVPNSLIIFNVFPNRWEELKQALDDSVVGRMSQYEAHLHLPAKDKLKGILQLNAQQANVEIDTLFELFELTDVLEQRSIRSVLNRAAAYYRAKASNLSLPLETPTQKESVRGNVETKLEELDTDVKLIKQGLNNLATALQPFIVQEIDVQEGDPSKSLKSAEDSPEPILSEKTAKTIKKKKTKASKLTDASETLDSPSSLVSDYLKQKRDSLEKAYDKPTIIADSDDLGKLRTIVEAFQKLKTLDIEQLELGKSKLPEHLLLKTEKKSYVLGFLNISGGPFTTRLKNFNIILSRNPEIHFYLIRDVRQANITGEVGKEEVEKFNNANNSTFIIMDKQQRLSFELAYYLIIGIHNRDLEVDLEVALQELVVQSEKMWLFDVLI